MTKTQLCTWLTIKEIFLWLTCTGQDFNENNYKIVSDSQPKTWIHAHDSTHGTSIGFSPGIKFHNWIYEIKKPLLLLLSYSTTKTEEFPVHSRDLCRGLERPARLLLLVRFTWVAGHRLEPLQEVLEEKKRKIYFVHFQIRRRARANFKCKWERKRQLYYMN